MTFQNNIDELQKSTVIDRNGDKIGSVGQVYVHNSTNNPSWVTVNTGLFGTKETFIPLNDAKLKGEEIHVPYEKDFVKDAPNIDEDSELSPEQENELYRYYGVQDDKAEAGVAGDADRAGEAGVAGTAGVAGAAGAVDGQREGVVAEDAHATAGHEGVAGQEGVAAADAHAAGDVNADQKVTLHEERVNIGKEKVETGRVRLRKHVVTDTRTVEVPVEREELVVERTPATGDAPAGTVGEEEVEVSLSEERPVVDKETVATEDVHVGTRTVQDTERVSTDVAHEEVDVDNVDGRTVDPNRTDNLG